MNILMYHSISAGRGPVCTPPEVFRSQMAALEAAGMRAVTLDCYVEARRAGERLEDAVVLTFDDGFADVAEVAGPELARRGWRATLFLPATCIETGRLDSPHGGRLVTWTEAASLAAAGWEIGSHALTHRDLTRLPADEALAEMRDSGRCLEERLGMAVRAFAAPFGRLPAPLRAKLPTYYRCAVGTRMDLADDTSDLFALPRIDMCYFRNVRRWRAHLAGLGARYFRWRQILRRLRRIPSGES